MTQATYKFYVDWNNDGDFLDASEDCSADFRSATITRGFTDPVARVAQEGQATIELNNADRRYSPALHTATQLPRRRVKLDMTYGGITKTHFAGYIDKISPTSGQFEERLVTLECSDAMSILDRVDGRMALALDRRADQVVQAAVAAAYTPAATDYDAGINRLPVTADRWAWSVAGQAVEEVKASQKIGDACVADWGVFYISAGGVPTFRNRWHCPFDATTVLVLDGSMQDLVLSLSLQDVYNRIEVTCHPRAVGQVLEVLAALAQRDAPAIAAGESVTFSMPFRDPALLSTDIGGLNPLTPFAGTDYACTSDPRGSGADMTASVAAAASFYGDHVDVTLTNSAATTAYVQRLQVRGYAVRVQEPVSLVSDDPTSQAAYFRQALGIDAILLSDQPAAQALADYLLDRYKDPAAIIETVGIEATTSATRLAAVRDMELLQRVEISEYQTGLSNWTGYIWHIQEQISGWQHYVQLGLVEAYDVGTPFLIGDTFDSGHGMIY